MTTGTLAMMLTNSCRVNERAIISPMWGSPKATPKRSPEASSLHASENITGNDNRHIHLRHPSFWVILALSFSSIIISIPISPSSIRCYFLVEIWSTFLITREFSSWYIFKSIILIIMPNNIKYYISEFSKIRNRTFQSVKFYSLDMQNNCRVRKIADHR